MSRRRRCSLRSIFNFIAVMAMIVVLCIHVRGVKLIWDNYDTGTYCLFSTQWLNHEDGQTTEYGIWYRYDEVSEPHKEFDFGIVPH